MPEWPQVKASGSWDRLRSIGFKVVGAALRRDCFGAFSGDRGVKPLLHEMRFQIPVPGAGSR